MRLIVMKTKITLIFCAILLISFENLYSQNDIKTFDKKGENYIISLFGQYNSKEVVDFDGSWIKLNYNCCEIGLSQTDSHLDWMIIWSDSMCVLSDYIDGGVKVGDSISKLLGVDFSSTEYGRNKKGNNLCPIQQQPFFIGDCPHNFNYTVFGKEYQYFMFAVENNIIKAISFRTADEVPPGYDLNNKIW